LKEYPNAQIEDKMKEFLNFLDNKVKNEEVSSYAKYTLGYFSQSLSSLNSKIGKLKLKDVNILEK